MTAASVPQNATYEHRYSVGESLWFPQLGWICESMPSSCSSTGTVYKCFLKSFSFHLQKTKLSFIKRCFEIFIYFFFFFIAWFGLFTYLLLFLDLPLSMSFLPLHITFEESGDWVNLTPSWDAHLGTLFIHDVFHIFITWMLIVIFMFSYPDFFLRTVSNHIHICMFTVSFKLGLTVVVEQHILIQMFLTPLSKSTEHILY